MIHTPIPCPLLSNGVGKASEAGWLFERFRSELMGLLCGSATCALYELFIADGMEWARSTVVPVLTWSAAG